MYEIELAKPMHVNTRRTFHHKSKPYRNVTRYETKAIRAVIIYLDNAVKLQFNIFRPPQSSENELQMR